MTALGCAEVVPRLESHHRGDCSPELTLLLNEHLARCPACRRRLAHVKQLSSMISAWRPSRPPRQLRTEIAEAVSDQLAQAAATAWAERPRRSLQFFPAMSTWQRFATWLVIAALLFLGMAITYRIAVSDAPPQHPAIITPPSATGASAESAGSP